jgi:copper resistance protein B
MTTRTHRQRLARAAACLTWLVAGAAVSQPRTADVPPATPEDVAAAFPDLGGMDSRRTMPENPYNTSFLFDQLEVQNADGGDLTSWDVTGWTGRNYDRLWIRTEGERQGGDTENAELELLYGHSIAPWWDLVAGVREDFDPGPSQGWAAFGVQGLAPYRFELEATMYAGDGGRAAARLKAEYELLMTQRLILQPHVELNWYGQSDAVNGIGPGFATAEVGLRLRYEIRRRIAPYIGVVRESKHGATADLARSGGADTKDTRLVAGIRFWF